MAFTMTPAGVLDQIYTTRITLEDFMAEKVKKVSRLSNEGVAGNMQSFWQAFEATTNAGLMLATQSAEVIITGQSTTITSTGQNWAGVEHVLLLGFTRVHPLNPAKMLTASFGIPAPVNAIVDTSEGRQGKPFMVRGEVFPGADVTEALGAMVDFLEDAIVYTDVAGTVHVGGWSYSEAASGLYSNPRIIDGVTGT